MPLNVYLALIKYGSTTKCIIYGQSFYILKEMWMTSIWMFKVSIQHSFFYLVFEMLLCHTVPHYICLAIFLNPCYNCVCHFKGPFPFGNKASDGWEEVSPVDAFPAQNEYGELDNSTNQWSMIIKIVQAHSFMSVGRNMCVGRNMLEEICVTELFKQQFLHFWCKNKQIFVLPITIHVYDITQACHLMELWTDQFWLSFLSIMLDYSLLIGW